MGKEAGLARGGAGNGSASASEGKMPTPAGGSRYVSRSVTVRANATGNTGGSEQVRAENERPIVRDAKALKAANAPTNRTGSSYNRSERAGYKAMGSERQASLLRQAQARNATGVLGGQHMGGHSDVAGNK